MSVALQVSKMADSQKVEMIRIMNECLICHGSPEVCRDCKAPAGMLVVWSPKWDLTRAGEVA